MAAKAAPNPVRPSTVPEFVRIYAPCERAVVESLQYRSSMHEAWEKSTNGDWLLWILDALGIRHPDMKPVREKLFGEVRKLGGGLLRPSLGAGSMGAAAVPPTARAIAPGAPATAASASRSVPKLLRTLALAKGRGRALAGQPLPQSRAGVAQAAANYRKARKAALAAFAERVRAVVANPFPPP